MAVAEYYVPAPLVHYRSRIGFSVRQYFQGTSVPSYVAFGALAAVFFVAIFARQIAPYDPLAAVGQPMTAPNAAYLLGTDTVGRDILSRVLAGVQTSWFGALAVVAFGVVFGGLIGLIAGACGGWFDAVLMRVTDVVYAFPDLLFVIIIVATLRGTALGDAYDGLLVIFVGIAVVNWVGVARLVRGQVLSVKNREFVEAARAVGAGPGRIMRKHVFPNILAPIIVTVAFAIPGAMLTESVLSFLGIGIRPPTPTWGVMINEGFIVFSTTPWPVLLPSMCISIVLLAFTFVGDGLRDALDPRSKM